MINGLYLWSAFLTSGHSKSFTILLNIHPFMHIFTHRRRRQPRKATVSSSGAVRVRCLGDTRLGGAGDRTNDLSPLPPYKWRLCVSWRVFCSPDALHDPQWQGAGLHALRPGAHHPSGVQLLHSEDPLWSPHHPWDDSLRQQVTTWLLS